MLTFISPAVVVTMWVMIYWSEHYKSVSGITHSHTYPQAGATFTPFSQGGGGGILYFSPMHPRSVSGP